MPDIDKCHIGVREHGLPVRICHYQSGSLADCVRQFDRSRGQHEACAESFYVPLPWTPDCFVEIIDVDNEVAFRSGKSAKIKDMAIAADLNANRRAGKAIEIVGHQCCRTAIKSERRN